MLERSSNVKRKVYPLSASVYIGLPRKKHTYPWRRNMTMCIAAISGYETDDPCIVVAADWRVETGIASAENAQKCTWINNCTWAVLMSADDTSRARELIRVCSHHFNAKKISKKNAVTVIKQAVGIQKRNLIEEYMQTKRGIT